MTNRPSLNVLILIVIGRTLFWLHTRAHTVSRACFY